MEVYSLDEGVFSGGAVLAILLTGPDCLCKYSGWEVIRTSVEVLIGRNKDFYFGSLPSYFRRSIS